MARHPALLLRAWPVVLSGPFHSRCLLAGPSLTTPPLDWHPFLLRPTLIPHSLSQPPLHLTSSSTPLLLVLLHAHSPFFRLFILPSFFLTHPTLHPSHSSFPFLPPLIIHFLCNAPILPSPDPVLTATCSVLLAYPSTYLHTHLSSEGLPIPLCFRPQGRYKGIDLIPALVTLNI